MKLFKWAKNKMTTLSRVEIFVILTILIAGTYIALTTPFGAGFDEETHLVRIWQMSALSFIPNEKVGQDMPYPAIYHNLSYRRDAIIRPVEDNFWATNGDLPLDAQDYIYTAMPTRSVYSPLLLLPHAMIMRYLGRAWDVSALKVFYISRLVGVLIYGLLAWYAVRKIPFGKWVMAVTALSPIVLFQAAVIGTDTLSFGIGFLFIAGCLAVAVKEEYGWLEWSLVVLLAALLFATKLNLTVMALLPLLILSPGRFTMKFGYLGLLLALAALWLIEVLGWGLIGFARLETAQAIADPAEQVKFMLTHPLQFAGILLGDISVHGREYYLEWIAVYGYKYWVVPRLVYFLFPLALALSLFSSENSLEPSRRIRFGLAFTFVVSALATIVAMYVSNTPVGSPTVDGVQGKYFVPIATLAILALTGLTRLKLPRWSIATVTTISLLLYLSGLYLSYHVVCGGSFYKTGLCYQPYYKNWAPNMFYSEPISSSFNLKQEIVPECQGAAEVRVWVDGLTAPQNGDMKFVLRDTESDSNLVEQTIPNNDLPSKGWLSLGFDPDWESLGKTYLLTIDLGEDSENPGGRFAFTQSGEYILGRLYENDTPGSRDLVFQYGCVAGLEKLLQSRKP